MLIQFRDIRPEGISKVCSVCGREFIAIGKHAQRQLVCSEQCHYEGIRGHRNWKSCVYCGESFLVVRSGQRYCSMKCRKLRMVGIRNPAWKGGVTSELIKLRNSVEYEVWRKAVFLRDSFTCKCCGTVGYDLVAHHSWSFVNFEEVRFDVDNGRTLCVKCHRYVHGLFGLGGFVPTCFLGSIE